MTREDNTVKTSLLSSSLSSSDAVVVRTTGHGSPQVSDHYTPALSLSSSYLAHMTSSQLQHKSLVFLFILRQIVDEPLQFIFVPRSCESLCSETLKGKTLLEKMNKPAGKPQRNGRDRHSVDATENINISNKPLIIRLPELV